nr:hypothetical protein [Caldilineaceae bacterium]
NGQLYISGLPLNPTDNDVAHQFTVVVPNQLAQDEAALTTLHRLIEAQKPAHTRYQLRVVEPGVRIGCQSTIGVDMLIGPYRSAPLGEMKLAASSQLPANRTLSPCPA